MTDPQQQALPPQFDERAERTAFMKWCFMTNGVTPAMEAFIGGDNDAIHHERFDSWLAWEAGVKRALAASAPSREAPENRYPPYGPQDHGEPNPWSATEFPDLTDEERAAAAGVPLLDDEGRAMIANSHHYTAENIQAVIDDLNAVARGEESVKWHDRDWRTQAAIYARIIQGLFHDVPVAPSSPSVAAEETKP